MLRDFLYQDSERVRSLLAQLDGGVVEEVVERVKTTRGAEGKGGLFGFFDLGASLAREKATEQTKTMQDAVYIVFEEAAEELSLLTAVEPDAAAWRSGAVHQRLREGQLLKSRAPTRILDARLFRERTQRFMDWAIAAARLEAHDDELPNDEERPTEEELVAAVKAELGHIPAIGELYASLMADQISVRQFPCGAEYNELSLSGTLLARPEFLQEEREPLFGKYGSAMSEWTMVSQVATLPAPDVEIAALPDDLPDGEGGSRRRLFFEELALFGMRTFEEQGFVEAPSFPAVHVTPLAVYRQVPAPPD